MVDVVAPVAALPTPPASPVTPAAPAPSVKALVSEALSVEQAVMAAPAGSEPKWAKPALAMVIMALFAGVMIDAAYIKDHDMLMMCWGVLSALISAVTHHYLTLPPNAEPAAPVPSTKAK